MSNVWRSVMMACATAAVANAQTLPPHFISPSAVDAGIQFPLILRDANVAGSVVADLQVDSAGLATIVAVRRSTHDLFTTVVRAAIRSWRFEPARIDGHPVSATVALVVDFQLSTDHRSPRQEIASVSEHGSNLHIDVGWIPIPEESVAGRVSDADLTAVASAALRYLLIAARPDSNRAVCIQWSGTAVAGLWPEVRGLVLRDRPDARDSSACPHTYASMIGPVDSAGRPVIPPAGALDPVRVSISGLRRWNARIFVLDGFVSLGTGTRNYACEARQAEPTPTDWTVTCELRSFTVS
jgi:hypothetical protein